MEGKKMYDRLTKKDIEKMEKEIEHRKLVVRKEALGSLTLCLPLDFHNPLHYSPLRLIFLSNFCFFSVLFCTLVV